MTETIGCDVLVIGGGPAGLAAAAGAARCDAEVALIEKYGFLGGMATAGCVGTICGLPPQGAPTPFSGLHFVRDWLDSLARACGTQVTPVPGGIQVLPYGQWIFRRLADELVTRSPHIIPVLHATLTSVTVDPDNAVDARALVWDRMVALGAKTLVDCTGEATAVHLAGGEVVDDDAPQAPGIVFTMEGVAETLEERSGRLSALLAISRAAEAGRLPAPCASASFVPGSVRDHRVEIKLSLAPEPNGEHWRGMTRAELDARRLVEELSEFLTGHVPAFRRARLAQVATQVGVRAGRRARGCKTLTEQDVLECRKHADSVAWGTWPIEEWDREGKPRMKYLPEGEYYGIPWECLRAYGLANVWMAGRCLSADRRALASARVIGTAMSTGWAAGTAAAYQATGRSLVEAVEFLRGGGIGISSQHETSRGFLPARTPKP